MTQYEQQKRMPRRMKKKLKRECGITDKMKIVMIRKSFARKKYDSSKTTVSFKRR